MNAPAILVVEDKALILMEFESGLEEAGFEVGEAIAAYDAAQDRFKALL